MTKEWTLKRKHLGVRRGICIESRKIHTSSFARSHVSQLDISQSFIPQLLRKDIKAFPYKLQTVHKLEEEDNDRELEMCETLLNHYENDPFSLDNIWFSDEAVSHLSGRETRKILKYGKQKIGELEEKSELLNSLQPFSRLAYLKASLLFKTILKFCTTNKIFTKQKILKLTWRKSVIHLSLLCGAQSPLEASSSSSVESISTPGDFLNYVYEIFLGHSLCRPFSRRLGHLSFS